MVLTQKRNALPSSSKNNASSQPLAESATSTPEGTPQNKNPKNKYLSALIAILVGGFGFHRFIGARHVGSFIHCFGSTGLPSVISVVEGLYFCSKAKSPGMPTAQNKAREIKSFSLCGCVCWHSCAYGYLLCN